MLQNKIAEKPFAGKVMDPKEAVQKVQEAKFLRRVVDITEFRGEITLEVRKDVLKRCLIFLEEDLDLALKF